MKAIMPKSIHLSVEFLESDRARLSYEEEFAEEHRAGFELSLEFVKKMFPQASIEGNTIHLTFEDTLTDICNFLTSEFLQWSSMGEIRMRDFILSTFMAGARVGAGKPLP